MASVPLGVYSAGLLVMLSRRAEAVVKVPSVVAVSVDGEGLVAPLVAPPAASEVGSVRRSQRHMLVFIDWQDAIHIQNTQSACYMNDFM